MSGVKRSRKPTGRQAETDLPRLAKPAQRALAAAGIATLADLAKRTDAGLLSLHGMGPNALATLRAALAAKRTA